MTCITHPLVASADSKVTFLFNTSLNDRHVILFFFFKYLLTDASSFLDAFKILLRYIHDPFIAVFPLLPRILLCILSGCKYKLHFHKSKILRGAKI